VPRNMQRHGAGGLRQLRDDGAILDLVENIARLALAGEAGKAGAAGADAPGGHGHGKSGDLVLDGVDGDAAPVEALAQRLVVAAQIRLAGGIVGFDDGWIDDGVGHWYLLKTPSSALRAPSPTRGEGDTRELPVGTLLPLWEKVTRSAG